MRRLRRRATPAEAPTEVQTETIEESGPPGPPVPPPGDRDIWPWLLVLLVLVLGGLLAAWLIARDDDKKKAQTTAPVTTVVTTAPATTQTVTNTTTQQGPRVTLANLLGIPVTTATKRLRRDGLRWRIRQVDSPKPVGIVAGQAPGPGTQLAKGDLVRLDVSKGPPGVAVPSLIGQDRQQAVAALERAGLKANVAVVASDKPEGQVVGQNPRAGAKAKRGSAVRVNVSNGGGTSPQPAPPPPPPTATTTTPATTAPAPSPPPPPPSAARVQVPDVVGLKLRAARQQIRAAGLVTEIKYVPNSQPEGTVVSQFPKAGKTVPRGEHVLVNVSLGPEPKPQVTVPNVVGQDEASARSALQGAGFVVDVADVPTDDSSQNGIVVDEQPPAGSKAPRGSEVTIYIARFSG